LLMSTEQSVPAKQPVPWPLPVPAPGASKVMIVGPAFAATAMPSAQRPRKSARPFVLRVAAMDRQETVQLVFMIQTPLLF
jgi:hypothetical protein